MISLFNPWTWIVLALAMLATAAGSFYAGIRVESNHRDAQQLVQANAMHDAYVKKVGEYRGTAQQISQELSNEKTKRTNDAVAFRDELRRAQASGKALVRCPKPSDQAGTGARLTGEFGRLFDRAVEIGVPGAGGPGRADAADTGAQDVDPAEVLTVTGDNAEAWAECRAIARGWQTLAKRNGWVK